LKLLKQNYNNPINYFIKLIENQIYLNHTKITLQNVFEFLNNTNIVYTMPISQYNVEYTLNTNRIINYLNKNIKFKLRTMREERSETDREVRDARQQSDAKVQRRISMVVLQW
jgi:hypothetical protein